MGVFPLSDHPPTSQTASINMISTSHAVKGKETADESTSFSPFEEIYNAIQATSDSTINDHLLVASDYYHMPYWLETPPISILSFTHTSYRRIYYGSYVVIGDSLGRLSSQIFFPSPFPYGRRPLHLHGFI